MLLKATRDRSIHPHANQSLPFEAGLPAVPAEQDIPRLISAAAAVSTRNPTRRNSRSPRSAESQPIPFNKIEVQPNACSRSHFGRVESRS